MITIRDLIKGLRCETCSEERRFGSPPDDSPDNLYAYTDLYGATRCFCKKHMAFYTEEGAMVDINHKDGFVGHGAKLISEFLEGFEDGR